MATIKWISCNDGQRGASQEKRCKATQVAKVITIGLALVLSLLTCGCKTSPPTRPVDNGPAVSISAPASGAQVERPSVRPQSQNELAVVDLDTKAPISLASFQEESDSPTSRRLIDDLGDSQELEDANAAPVRRAMAIATSLQVDSGGGSGLRLDEVFSSVVACYPEIEIALARIDAAGGKVVAAWGKFDEVFSAHSISQPLGFYQTYRNGAGITRPLFGGGEVYGTYRIGDGNFEPWFGERETNEGGEFKAGFSLPLLKDRQIDSRRAKLWSARANLEQTEADVQSAMLNMERDAARAYWDWVASGLAVKIQQRLLDLAQTRVSQIQVRIEAGDLAEIAEIDNDRFVAKRKNSLVKARRAMEKAAIKLSLYYRDDQCCPHVPVFDELPEFLSDSVAIEDDVFVADLSEAQASRPELVELAAQRKAACVDLRYAENLTLTKLDFKGFAGQDIGGETSPTGDKTPFELQLGVLAEVPIQRREGTGKIRIAQAKLSQIDAKLQFVSEKIAAEIQDATSAINAAHEQIEQSQNNLRLAERSLELGREAFDSGDIDLISLNIYETSVADAQLQLLDAQFKYFFYQTVYNTAVGRSRLAQ